MEFFPQVRRCTVPIEISSCMVLRKEEMNREKKDLIHGPVLFRTANRIFRVFLAVALAVYVDWLCITIRIARWCDALTYWMPLAPTIPLEFAVVIEYGMLTRARAKSLGETEALANGLRRRGDWSVGKRFEAELSCWISFRRASGLLIAARPVANSIVRGTRRNNGGPGGGRRGPRATRGWRSEGLTPPFRFLGQPTHTLRPGESGKSRR